jgi:hypothetical protein
MVKSPAAFQLTEMRQIERHFLGFVKSQLIEKIAFPQLRTFQS